MTDVVAQIFTLTIFILFNIHRIHRPRSGWGRTRTAAPRDREHGEGRSSAAKLREASPPKGTSSADKILSGHASTSMAPPTGSLANPTYIHAEKRGSPDLPPPERPTEGRESAESTAALRIDRGEKQIASLL